MAVTIEPPAGLPEGGWRKECTGMARHTVLVLGGGWGGLTAAHHLRRLLPDDRIRVVEKTETFSLGPSYLWLMTGEREVADVERPMASLLDTGIEWVHADVTAVDAATRTVRTTSGDLEGDAVIVALGADLAPDGVPGFAAYAHNLYDARGAAGLGTALARFEGGRIAVLITRTPFRCPAAPYEAALLIEAAVRRRGIRDRVEITLYTPEKQPMPVAGPAVGEALAGMLDERGIRYQPGRTVSSIDGARRAIVFAEGDAAYDLLVGVPPHRAASAVRDSGLVDETGYVAVHPQTLELLSDPESLETRHPGVHAIGDTASIRLLNGLLLPKAGVFAEAEARVVAANVAARLLGERPAARYDGSGFCYIDVGDGMAAYGDGDFYAYPGPRVSLHAPSQEYRRAKEEFEAVLRQWFTSPSGSRVPV